MHRARRAPGVVRALDLPARARVELYAVDDLVGDPHEGVHVLDALPHAGAEEARRGPERRGVPADHQAGGLLRHLGVLD